MRRLRSVAAAQMQKPFRLTLLPSRASFSKLMVASQKAETKIFSHWWSSWFGAPMQICSAQERASMPGLLNTAEVAKTSIDSSLILEPGITRERSRWRISQLRDGSDPRLQIMAHAIRHAEQGEIALMHGVSGRNAVSVGFRNMFADNVNARTAFGVNRAH